MGNYNVKTTGRTAVPRSKRLREVGGYSSSGTIIDIGSTLPSPGSGDGHTHANKTVLDAISFDDDYYLWIKQKVEGENESAKHKVKAGYADNALANGNGYVLDWFIPETVDGSLILKLNPVYAGVWAEGFITAGGIGSGGSGGGGIDIDRVWESLTNNTDKPNVLINQAHIPIVPQSKVDGLAATLASIYTKSETDAQIAAAIAALPSPMVFQGSLGTDGTITTLPAASSSNEGWTYKVITAGTYQGIAAKVGDTFISNGTEWIHIPSGDEPNGTVTSVGLSVPTGLSVAGSPITTSGTLKITFASGYSIPTNAKQNAWTAKYDKPSTGIPLSDLASGVQTSLGLADSALQSHQTIYALTIKNSAGTTQLTYTPNSGAGSITLTKAMVGLSNVENTKLSTWTGTNKITTLGTITIGVWHGTAIANEYLANSSITIGSKSISLGGSATLTQIGVPAWAQASALAFGSLPSMYIAKNAVQSSSAVQNLSGLGNLEPDTDNAKDLGSSSKAWRDVYSSAGHFADLYAHGGDGYIYLWGSEPGEDDRKVAYVDFYGLHPASNDAYDLGYTAQRWRNIRGVNGDFSGTMNVTGATSLSGGLTVSGNSSLHGNVTIGAGTTYPSFTLNANSQQGLKLTGEDATGSNDYLIFKLGKLGVHTTPTSSSSTVDINGTAFVSGLARFDAGVKLVTTKKIWFGDTYYIELDSNNYLHTNAPFYSDGFITAGGIGTSGGSGGGGIDLDRVWESLTNNTDKLNVTINVAHIPTISTTKVDGLETRLAALEGGSATSITTTGSGNVVSSVTKSGTTITVTKGITALTSHQSLDGYVNEIATGTGNYITGVSKSGKKLTFTYGTLPTTIALSNVTGADDLKAIEALTGTSGLLKKTAANTWTLDTTSYATAASLGNYLPLSGGTISGEIDLSGGGYIGLQGDNILSVDGNGNLEIGAGIIGGDVKIEGGGDLYYNNHIVYDSSNLTKSVITKLLGSNTYAPYNSAGYLPLSGGQMTGPLTWKNSTALPEASSASYFLTIDSFASGGTTKWVSLANVKTSLGLGNYLPLAGGTMTGDIDLATNSKGIKFDTASSWSSSDRTIPFSSNGDDSYIRYYYADADKGLTYNPSTGALKAGSFVKRGGTSSQFLKADGSVDSNAYLTTSSAADTYVKLNPGAAEQTIRSSISFFVKGVVNLWRSSGDHYTFLGFSNGTTETYLGGIGFKSQSDHNLYRKDGSNYYKIYDESNLTLTKSLVTDALGGTPSSMWYAYNGTAGYWKIHIKSKTGWFLAFSINLYTNYRSSVIRVSGYNYSTTKKWYNPKAFMIGYSETSSIDVTFGMDGDRDLWVVVPVNSYNGISITDVVYGNGGAGLSYDADAFEITKITEIPETVTNTITVYPPLYLNGGTISGNLSVTGTLGVTGAATMSSTLSVNGALSVQSGVNLASLADGINFVSSNNTVAHIGANASGSVRIYSGHSISFFPEGATAASAGTGILELYSTGATLYQGLTVGGELSLTGSSKKLWFGDTYYIELDENNYLHSNAPFWSDGFITAGGIGSGGGGGGITIDSALSATSENPVQNKVIYAAIGNVESALAAI